MRICTLCGKRTIVGGKRVLLRGHYNPTGKRRKYPNLQWMRLPHAMKGYPAGTRLRACTKCIRTLERSPRT